MEKITVKKLKEILAQFPDEEAVVRIEDHYIGYGLNATVFKQISTKNIRKFINCVRNLKIKTGNKKSTKRRKIYEIKTINPNHKIQSDD